MLSFAFLSQKYPNTHRHTAEAIIKKHQDPFSHQEASSKRYFMLFFMHDYSLVPYIKRKKDNHFVCDVLRRFRLLPRKLIEIPIAH